MEPGKKRASVSTTPSVALLGVSFVFAVVLFSLTCATYRGTEFDRPVDFDPNDAGFQSRGGWARQNDKLRQAATIFCALVCIFGVVSQHVLRSLAHLTSFGLAIATVLFFACTVMDGRRLAQIGTRLCPVNEKLSRDFDFHCDRAIYTTTCVFDALCCAATMLTACVTSGLVLSESADEAGVSPVDEEAGGAGKSGAPLSPIDARKSGEPQSASSPTFSPSPLPPLGVAQSHSNNSVSASGGPAHLPSLNADAKKDDPAVKESGGKQDAGPSPTSSSAKSASAMAEEADRSNDRPPTDRTEAKSGGRPALGMSCRAPDGARAGTGGLEVQSVFAGGPADSAGLRPGDIILAVAGMRTNTNADMEALLSRSSPGDTYPFLLSRGGREQSLAVTLGTTGDAWATTFLDQQKKDGRKGDPPSDISGQRPPTGKTDTNARRERVEEEARRKAEELAEIDQDARVSGLRGGNNGLLEGGDRDNQQGAEAPAPVRQWKQDEARERLLNGSAMLGMSVQFEDEEYSQPSRLFVQEVKPGGAAAHAGLQPDDVILRVGVRAIGTLEDFKEAVDAFPGEKRTFCIQRDSKRFDLDLQFGMRGHTMAETAALRAVAGAEWCTKEEKKRRLARKDAAKSPAGHP